MAAALGAVADRTVHTHQVMNVWRMQCVGFDVKFLQAIHEKHNNYVPVPRVKRERKPVASNNAPPGL